MRTLKHRRRFAALPGLTMIEMMVAVTVFGLAIATAFSSLHSFANSAGMQAAVAQQVRTSEAFIDSLLIATRWASASDPQLICNFPSQSSGVQNATPPTPMYPANSPAVLLHVNDGTTTWNSAYPPMFTFRRIKSVNDSSSTPTTSTAQYQYYNFGDTITYYWLPSPTEWPKYAQGSVANWNSGDIDGLDHGSDGIKNAGVIWRRIDKDTTAGVTCISPLGSETFAPGVASDVRIVLENVPPPFYVNGGVTYPTDAFKVLVDFNNQLVKIYIKRYVDTGVAGVGATTQFEGMDYSASNNYATTFIQFHTPQNTVGEVGTSTLSLVNDNPGGLATHGSGSSSSGASTTLPSFFALEGVTPSVWAANSFLVTRNTVTIISADRTYCIRN